MRPVLRTPSPTTVVGFASVVVFAGGAIVLMGWWLTLPRLTDWMDNGISMMPNTALCLMLCAAALALGTARFRPLSIVLALLSGIIGLLTLVEHLFFVDLGIDQLLIHASWGQNATMSPGRMGLPATLMFILLNGSVVLSGFHHNARRVAAAIAAVAIVIASFSIIGFLFGATHLYIVPELTAIALPTALLFGLLGIGCIAALPDTEPMRTLVAPTAAGALVRRALPLVVLVPIVMGWLRWQGQLAGWYDAPFGTAMRTIGEIFLLLGMLCWMVVTVARHERGQRATAQALRTSEERYRSFVQQSSEGIWRCELTRPMPSTLSTTEALDWVYAHGWMAECNDAMARMYGYERGEQLVGARLDQLLPRNADNEAYITAFLGAGYNLQGGESEERDKDGRIVYFSNNLVGIVENDLLVRAWGTQLDITERKRSNMALREADRRKDEFLATLSHELRNPLGPLMNGMELLPEASGPDADATRQLHAMMRRQLQHLVHLIDDLMDVSRISRGKITLRQQPTDLNEVLSMAVDSCRPQAQAAAHVLEVERGGGPLVVHGDQVRLVQIFANILHNAVKYTPPGGRIVLRTERNGDTALISVQDNGIGIPQEHLASIFEMFNQVPPPLGRLKEGLGIGLNLVKSLVELHGGAVHVESAGADQGTTFLVRLPLVANTTDPELAQAAHSA